VKALAANAEDDVADLEAGRGGGTAGREGDDFETGLDAGALADADAEPGPLDHLPRHQEGQRVA